MADKKPHVSNPLKTGTFTAHKITYGITYVTNDGANYTYMTGNYTYVYNQLNVQGDTWLHGNIVGNNATKAENYSTALGDNTVATGINSLAEGIHSKATNNGTHAEGAFTTASGEYSHAEGVFTVASGESSHAEGGVTYALGGASHAEGFFTYTYNHSEHASGQFNISKSRTGKTDFGPYEESTLFTVGNGYSNKSNTVTVQSNALEIRQTGTTYINGSTYIAKDTYISGILDTTGITSLHNTLNVDGSTYIAKDTYISGILDTTSITSLHNTLNVDGSTYIAKDTYVSGILDTTGITSLHNTLNVDGSTYIAKDIYISGILDTTGITSLHNTLNVDGSTYIAKDTYVSGILDVTNVTNLHNNLNVTGVTNLTGKLYPNGDIDMTTNITQTEKNANETNFVKVTYFTAMTGNHVSTKDHDISLTTYVLPTKKYVDALLAAKDALIYKGSFTPSNTGIDLSNEKATTYTSTINGTWTTSPNTDTSLNDTTGVFTETDTGADAGSVYKVSKDGWFGNTFVHAGDLLISYSDTATKTDIDGWNIIETHISNLTSVGKDRMSADITATGNHIVQQRVLTNVNFESNGTVTYTYNDIKFDLKPDTGTYINTTLNQYTTTDGLNYNISNSTHQGVLGQTQFINNVYMYNDNNGTHITYTYARMPKTYTTYSSAVINNLTETKHHNLLGTGNWKNFITGVNIDSSGHLTYTYLSTYVGSSINGGDPKSRGEDPHAITYIDIDTEGNITYHYVDMFNKTGIPNKPVKGGTPDIVLTGTDTYQFVTGIQQNHDGSVTYTYAGIKTTHGTDKNTGTRGAGKFVITYTYLNAAGVLTYQATDLTLTQHQGISGGSKRISGVSGLNVITGLTQAADGAITYEYNNINVTLTTASKQNTINQINGNVPKQVLTNIDITQDGIVTYTFADSIGTRYWDGIAYKGEIFNDYGANAASGNYSHAEGCGSKASGIASHAEGESTASANYSHSEGLYSTASGNYSHAEGYNSDASAQGAHSEGFNSTASGNYSHAEGVENKAIGIGSHAEGYQTITYANYSHVDGYRSEIHTNAVYSHASGVYTYTYNTNEFSVGRYNYSHDNHSGAWGPYNDSTLFSVGNGGSLDNRKNALEIMQTGTTYITGYTYLQNSIEVSKDLTVNGNITNLANVVNNTYITYTESKAIAENNVKFISDINLSKTGVLTYNVARLTYATGATYGTAEKGLISIATANRYVNGEPVGLSINNGILSFDVLPLITLSGTSKTYTGTTYTSVSKYTTNQYTTDNPVVTLDDGSSFTAVKGGGWCPIKSVTNSSEATKTIKPLSATIGAVTGSHTIYWYYPYYVINSASVPGSLNTAKGFATGTQTFTASNGAGLYYWILVNSAKTITNITMNGLSATFGDIGTVSIGGVTYNYYRSASDNSTGAKISITF